MMSSSKTLVLCTVNLQKIKLKKKTHKDALCFKKGRLCVGNIQGCPWSHMTFGRKHVYSRYPWPHMTVGRRQMYSRYPLSHVTVGRKHVCGRYP